MEVAEPACEGIALLTNTFRNPKLMATGSRRLERWIDSCRGPRPWDRPPQFTLRGRARSQAVRKTGATGLEPATSGVTGRRSNQLNYAPLGRSIVA